MIWVEYAAPLPYFVIRRKHRMIFVVAPINLVQAAYLVNLAKTSLVFEANKIHKKNS